MRAWGLEGLAGLGVRWTFALLILLALAPAAGWSQVCTADCDGDGSVTVDEIVTIVNIALGNRPVADCPAGDSSNDGDITVDEIVAGLNFALDGCPVPAPTPTPTPVDDAVRIDVGTASGAPGSVVTIAVTLAQSGGVVTATSNDISYDRNQVRILVPEPVSCTINPAIGSGTAPNKMLIAGTLETTGAVETVRIGVISFTNQTPIPDGLLFTCDFQIMPAASAGNKVLVNLPDASLADGTAPPVVGADGSITVAP